MEQEAVHSALEAIPFTVCSPVVADTLGEFVTKLRDRVTSDAEEAHNLFGQATEYLKNLGPGTSVPAQFECAKLVVQHYFFVGQFEKGVDAAEVAVKVASLRDDLAQSALAHQFAGVLASETYNYPAALSHYSRALQCSEEAGDSDRRAMVLNNLGAAHQNVGQYADAVRVYEAVLSLNGSSKIAAAARQCALGNIAQISLYVRDVGRGIEAAEEAVLALQDAATASDFLNRCRIECIYAQLLVEVHQFESASQRARLSRHFANLSKSPIGDLTATAAEGLAEVAAGRCDVGLTRLKLSLEGARRVSPVFVKDALVASVKGYNLAGQPDVASLLLRELLDLNRRSRVGRLHFHQTRYLNSLTGSLEDKEHQANEADGETIRARLSDRGMLERQLKFLEGTTIAAELHDDDTGMHIFRVGQMTGCIAERFGLAPEIVSLMNLAARMHDIGKVVIPESILMKPGKFTPGERAIMETHTTEGARIVNQNANGMRQMDIAEEIALSHHEKWDGTGYPNKLSGTQIPLSARIVALADVFDALTHARCYKAAWTVDDALKEISAQRGKHFDPELTDLFLQLVPDLQTQYGDLDAFLSHEGRNNDFLRDRAGLNARIRSEMADHDSRR